MEDESGDIRVTCIECTNVSSIRIHAWNSIAFRFLLLLPCAFRLADQCPSQFKRSSLPLTSYNMSDCTAGCGQTIKSHLLFYTCQCTQQRFICEPCVKGMARCTNGAKCPLCRDEIKSLAKVIQVSDLVAKSQRLRGPNYGVDRNSFAFRWEVSAILGIRATSVHDAEYLVKWTKPRVPGRTPKSTWESSSNLTGGGDMVQQFHTRHGLHDLHHVAFEFPIRFQISEFKESKESGKVFYKCSHTNCAYTSNKRSNIQAHIKTHSVTGSDNIRFACPMCSSTFGLNAALTKHVKKFHSSPSQLLSSAPIEQLPEILPAASYWFVNTIQTYNSQMF